MKAITEIKNPERLIEGFDNYFDYYGLSATDYGREYQVGNDVFEIVGLRLRRNDQVAIRNTATNEFFWQEANIVRHYLR